MAESGGKRAIVIIGAVAIAALAIWGLFMVIRVDSNATGKVEKAIAKTAPGKAAEALLMSEEERMKYIEQHVRIDALEFAPDTKPDGDGGTIRVGGLMRVTGKVTNAGDQPVTPVNLVLTTLGETNEVLGTYVEDVSGKKRLEPGATRDFKFEIPDKKAFAGRYVHKLR